VFALLTLPCPLLAQTELNLALSEDAFTDDMPIVLSASRLAQPLSEAPVAMTVIDRDMIEASGARNIPDLMRLVPGFQVGYFDGNSPVVAYHGHSAEHNTRLQVLIDGRSVYEPARDAVPWLDLEVTLDDIERIEVIRGPNASTYGNNSFFAVISITTRHAVESQGQYVRVRAGSHDTRDATYTFGDSRGNLDYRFTLNTVNDNGTDFLRDETEADGMNYRLDWQLSDNDRIMYQGGYKQTLFGDHESVGDDPLIGHDIENTTAFQQIKWEHMPEPDRGFSLQYYYNYYDSLEISPVLHVDPPFYAPYDYTMDVYVKSQRHDVEFNQYLKPLENIRLVWGSSVRQELVSGTLDEGSLFITDGTQHLDLYRGFAHGEWNFAEGWLLNAGYMVEYNDISGNDRSPRLALIHHINNQHTIRIGVSRATRTPTLFEESGQVIFRYQPLVYDFLIPIPPYPNYNEAISTSLIDVTNLDSEKIRSTEIGYIGEFFEGNLTFDARIFRDETSRLLNENQTSIPAPLPNQLELNSVLLGESGMADYLVNELATIIRGLELAMDYKPTRNVRAYLFYSHLDIDSTGTVIEEDLNNSVPNDSGGLMLTRHWNNNIDTSLMYYRYENFDWLDRTGEDSADAYSKLDLRIAKSWVRNNENIQLAIIGQNLLGNFYDYNKTTYDNTGQMDRHGSLQDQRIYLELSLKFN